MNESEPEKEEIEDAEQDQMSTTKGPSIRVQKNHPRDLIIGNPDQGITTRRSVGVIANFCFVFKIKPKNFKEALTDEFWIEAMQEELNQFKRSEVWDLVPRPKGINVIGTKWIYKNKSNEKGTQIEGPDFDETFAPVARLESIRLLLGVSCILKFKLFQMDVKSAFLSTRRPYITFVVGVCGRYQAKPKMSHLTQVKRILKYINITNDYGILDSYIEDSKLMGYCDAD